MHNATSLENYEEQPFTATHRVRIDCAYDGSLFSGWAAQPNLVTVQGVIENALELILRAPHRVVVAGRTDAGVHAEAQTLHCDLSDEDWTRLQGRTGEDDPTAALGRRLTGALQRCLYDAEEQLNLPKNVRGILQGAIQIHRVSEVPFDLMRASPLPAAAMFTASQMVRRTVLTLCTAPTLGQYLSIWIALILTNRHSSYSVCVISSLSASRVKGRLRFVNCENSALPA